MGLIVAGERFFCLPAYRAYLTAGGLSQPDIVISFTGLQNKAERVETLAGFDPVMAARDMKLTERFSKKYYDKYSFPEGMPDPFTWKWCSTGLKEGAQTLPYKARVRAFRFNTVGEFSSEDMPFMTDIFKIVLRPTGSEMAYLGPYMGRINARLKVHAYEIDLDDSIADARFIPYDKTMVVHNIQTNLFAVRMPTVLRTRYNNWQRHLMMAVEDFAWWAGFESIYLTTAFHQMNRWRGGTGGGAIHPNTAYWSYSLEPYMLGYSLRTVPEINVDWKRDTLFWTKSRPDFFHIPMLLRQPQ